MKQKMLVSENELSLGIFEMTIPATPKTIENELGNVKCTEGATGIVFPGDAINVVNYTSTFVTADMKYDGDMYSFEFSAA